MNKSEDKKNVDIEVGDLFECEYDIGLCLVTHIETFFHNKEKRKIINYISFGKSYESYLSYMTERNFKKKCKIVAKVPRKSRK